MSAPMTPEPGEVEALRFDLQILRDECDRLRAQVLNLNRWVGRVNAKHITSEAVERGASALYRQRYGWGGEEDDWNSSEIREIYREEAEACLRAALEVQQ